MEKTRIKYKLVYLEWADALYTSDWISKRRIKSWARNSDWIVNHVGWIIEENDRYTIIASRLSLKGENDEFGSLQKIPRTWIRRRKILKI